MFSFLGCRGYLTDILIHFCLDSVNIYVMFKFLWNRAAIRLFIKVFGLASKLYPGPITYWVILLLPPNLKVSKRGKKAFECFFFSWVYWNFLDKENAWMSPVSVLYVPQVFFQLSLTCQAQLRVFEASLQVWAYQKHHSVVEIMHNGFLYVSAMIIT